MKNLILIVYLCGLLPSLLVIYKLSYMTSKNYGALHKDSDRNLAIWAMWFWPFSIPIVSFFLILSAFNWEKLHRNYKYWKATYKEKFFNFLDKILNIRYE